MKDYSELKVPTIHLNGSGGRRLADDLNSARLGVLNAIELLHQTSPHGRDYYPQDVGVSPIGAAFKQAEKEHNSRVERLKDVLHELSYIEEQIHQAHRR